MPGISTDIPGISTDKQNISTYSTFRSLNSQQNSIYQIYKPIYQVYRPIYMACRPITARKRSKNLARAKEAAYWKSEIYSAGNNARHMWRTVNNLLGEAKSGAKPTFTPDVYHCHIDKKISDVRAATSSAAPPTSIFSGS